MRHTKAIAWEKKLKSLFDRIDDFLEEKYGQHLPLHPARASRGSTSSKDHDGLFNVGASFSMGIGSKLGPGYVLEVRISTLAQIPPAMKSAIDEDVVGIVRERLGSTFPGKDLRIDRDGSVYKIHGDLSLGKVR